MAETKQQNLFFALWPDAEVRAAIYHLQQSLSECDGRTQHPDDLHMTLVFLGKVDTDHIPCIRKVAASITVQPFTLELSEVHHWKRPRVLWCGPDHIPLQLSKLVNDLQQGLIACGFEPEERDYKPHVTLMRKVKDVQRMQPLDRPVKWKPREFVLAGSHFGAKPPRYSIMNRWSI